MSTFKTAILILCILISGCTSKDIALDKSINDSRLNPELIGKWAMLIKSPGEDRSNYIYLQVSFKSDGTAEYIGSGIVIEGEKAAIYEISEIKKWQVENGYLIENQKSCTLSSVSGDPALIKIVDSLFKDFYGDRKGQTWKTKIIEINSSYFKLLTGSKENEDQYLVYYKIVG